MTARRVGSESAAKTASTFTRTQASAAARASAIVPVARGRQCSGTPATSSGTSGRSTTTTRVPSGWSSSVHSTRDGMPVASSSQRKRSSRSASTSSITPSRVSPVAQVTRSGAPSSGSRSTSSASHSLSSRGSVSSAQARSRSTGRTISRRTADTGYGLLQLVGCA